jgi:basic membrane protein A
MAMARNIAIAIALVAGLLLGAVVTYAYTTSITVPRSEYESLKQTSVSKMEFEGLQSQLNSLKQQLPDLPWFKENRKLRAAFIYVGPIGDLGWSHAHDQGRLIAQKNLPWLETFFAEKIVGPDTERIIDRFIRDQKVDVIITTSFDHMDDTINAAKRYPDKLFIHVSGFKRAKNVATIMADFYQLYYLNGLMAGALTKTNKIGYVAAHTIPEVVRHINAFVLGVREVNPTATVDIRVLRAWYDPARARLAAEALIAEGVDVIAFTEDTETIVKVAEEHTLRGRQIYVFGHYSPMLRFGPNSVVSGQLVHWEVMYEYLLNYIYWGQHLKTPNGLADIDLFWTLREGAVELGADFKVPINPKFIPALKEKTVTDRVTGKTMSVYDLVFLRLSQMSTGPATFASFEPFTGPIKDNQGKLAIPPGKSATLTELLNIDWFVEGVVRIVEVPRPK